MKTQTTRGRLLASTMICGAMALMAASPAFAQEDAMLDRTPADAGPTEVEGIVITGSRIVRQDYIANSPIATVSGEAAVANADITLETYLNTLPQVNPAGTTTSNNPGNNGQANIDLRGLGANRNIVLVDGRRAMVSSNTLLVDVNTIPQAMIENIEIITGGAGATYGADAIAGAVNIILKKDFEGVDLLANYSNSTEFWDAEEYQFSAVIGGNFADGKGNAVLGFDRSYREPLIKSQRAFSQNATSTTSFLPEGALFWSGDNPIPEAAIDALFATYGVAADEVVAQSGTLGFNLNGTLFYKGVFNSPLDVQNYLYPIDGTVNQNLYPDLYSYNFDFVNLLVLPMDRYSFMSKINYEMDNGVEFFASLGWTEYTAATALAPTPFPTVNTRNGARARADDVATDLVENTCPTATDPNAPCNIAQLLVVPAFNPFIPDDLRTLLDARTGNDPRLVGSGADEPFLMRQRTLDLGLRQSEYENTVVQFLAGLRAPLGDSGWELEASIQEGRTEIDETQFGNLDTQRLQGLLEEQNPQTLEYTGGTLTCEGGFNIFGRQPISAECADYLESTTTLSTEMKSQIAQAFVRGPVFALPAGQAMAVFGAEYRGFEYDFDPGSASGPISGFNTQDPDAGNNAFYDLFGELLLPIVSDMPFAQALDVTLGYRYSWSEFTDKITGQTVGPRGSPAWKIEANWQVMDPVRVRASYQRSVREPNFSELFAGGGSAPQYFDPCSVTTNFRMDGGADARQLCLDAGIPGFGGVSGAAVDTYVQTPGNQIGVDLAGNTGLQPEKGTTFTIGAVINSWSENPWLSRLRGSVDYYNIQIDDAILTPTPNQIVAACYNYYGTNPDLDPANENCMGLLRFGGDILWIYNPATGFSDFIADNGGSQQTSGIDFQADWGFDWDLLGWDRLGSFRLNALLTHIIEFKQQDPINGVPELDFAGTISYFGAGLGTSFPEWKGVFNAIWDVEPVEVGVRARYIGEMENRLNIEFPGETSFTGVDSIWYWDLWSSYNVNDNVEVRLGVNNLFDQDPETYNPNVQSGTDPSTYDVIGRRVFGGIRLRF